MKNYSIALPGRMEEMDCQKSKHSIINCLKRTYKPDTKVCVKFVTDNEGYFKLSEEPVFVDDIARFRLYVNNKFISLCELIRR